MDPQLLQRRFERERKARKQAETVLEQKSLELFNANQDLRDMADGLELLVTDRTKALVDARDEAIRANRHKSEFLSRMSHELRTPMNAILGFSQLMESDLEDPLTPNQLESLLEISKAGQHLLELINEVLDLARIESGRLELTIESVDVGALIQECLQLVAPLADAHGVVITTAQLDNLRCNPLTDRIRLKQVMLNLLSNAIKYNRPRGRVEVTADFSSSDQRLRLRVRDTGVGISPAELAKIFEPFQRVSTTEHLEGTGIGLTISKRLIEFMGGEISADSTLGEGSCFRIELPADHTDCPRSREAPVSTDNEQDLFVSESGTVQARHHILYVEDNPANRKLVKHLLARRGDMELTTADTGEQGLEAAHARRPDVILMDLQLPGISGYDVLTALREDLTLRDIPVIALSANAMPADIDRGIAAGFLHYLAKPIRINELMEALDGILDS